MAERCAKQLSDTWHTDRCLGKADKKSNVWRQAGIKLLCYNSMVEISISLYFLYPSVFIRGSCKRQKRRSVSQSYWVTLANMNGYVHGRFFLGHTASKYAFIWGGGPNIFQKSGSHLQRVTWSKFHTQDPQNARRHHINFSRPGF